MDTNYEKGRGGRQTSSSQGEPTDKAENQKKRHQLDREQLVGKEEGNPYGQGHEANAHAKKHEGACKTSNTRPLETLRKHGRPKKFGDRAMDTCEGIHGC
jgi:hypothetical protein